jgi:CubicO group peptidase (beta-lactamase class C family)
MLVVPEVAGFMSVGGVESLHPARTTAKRVARLIIMRRTLVENRPSTQAQKLRTREASRRNVLDMRVHLFGFLFAVGALGALGALGACADAPPPAPASPQLPPAPSPAATDVTTSAPALTAPATRKLDADTPLTTTEGATFIGPAGWSVTVRGPATILEPPEGDSHIALVDVHAKDADAALAAGWAAYKPDAKWPLKNTADSPDKDGWTNRRAFDYQTSPNEKRDVEAGLRRAGDTWTVTIYDVAQAVGEKRIGALSLIFDRLLPKGYTRESFAGKKANKLDATRIAELSKWVETSMKQLGIPGVSIGLVQDGKVVFADGFGVRELGKKEKPDGDTLYMIASNTKAMTTLMLAKLVDEKKLSWETPVTQVLPSFKLGNAETTRQVLVKHLICACTGLPRQDLEWLFQFKGVTPEGAMGTLATVQPTSKFGEMFQYSNLLAGAGGFVGGHVAYPKLELGAAYDEAMRTLVFEPLGMKSTTFDFAKALRGNHASAHAPDVDGKPAKALMAINYAVIPLRPAGAAWSSVRDVLAYVQTELAEGALPNGKQYIGKEAILQRRAPQVPIGKDQTYGMGLEVNTKYGTPVVHHGGDMIGFHSDMMWLPEQNVGAVVLTNSDPGWILRSQFQRKLLEVLFDGKPEADADAASSAKTFFSQLAAERKLITTPADATEATQLARHYKNDALGDIAVSQAAGITSFDFGEWKSEVATRKNPDGTMSFITTTPGVIGFEFVVGKAGAAPKRTLVTRDAQHEYVFTEQ